MQAIVPKVDRESFDLSCRRRQLPACFRFVRSFGDGGRQSMIQYRRLGADEIDRELFNNFIRRQVVTKCWRKENGQWVIRDVPFIDDWTEEEFRELARLLRRTVHRGGFVCGAC